MSDRLDKSYEKKMAIAIAFPPAAYVFLNYFIIKMSNDDRIDKLYQLSGEWSLLFLYLSLASSPINEFLKKSSIKLSISQQSLIKITVLFTLIHWYAYLRYTLRRAGYTITAFIKQLNQKRYIIWGVIAFILVVSRLCLPSKFEKIKKFALYVSLPFASYHITTRNTIRQKAGYEPIRFAPSSPYIIALLLIYNIFKDIKQLSY
eukprot:220669_1